jgi:hypothetical protein
VKLKRDADFRPIKSKEAMVTLDFARNICRRHMAFQVGQINCFQNSKEEISIVHLNLLAKQPNVK